MPEKEKGRIFDLEERTAAFGEEAIKFASKIPKSSVTNSLITQFVKKKPGKRSTGLE